jgi:hypothetical protein
MAISNNRFAEVLGGCSAATKPAHAREPVTMRADCDLPALRTDTPNTFPLIYHFYYLIFLPAVNYL